MRLKNFFILSLFVTVFSISCEKDEEPGTEVVPPRDRGEQEVKDQEALTAYLETHFYNYEEFENPDAAFDYQVEFDTIAGENSDKTPLIDSDLLETKMVTREGVDYKLYILKVREGVGQQPTFADSAFASYRRELLNGQLINNSVTPAWFDLPGYEVRNARGQVVRVRNTTTGFAEAITEFHGASGYEVNPDNTISWNNDFGIGAVFLPSGLGYFSSAQAGVPPYSPLAISFNLLGANQADHDQDGIPSWQEDLNEDKNLFNDDTDEDGLSNYSDTDDDGDFTPTEEEIVIGEDGTVILPDTDGDGTPDYLDTDH